MSSRLLGPALITVALFASGCACGAGGGAADDDDDDVGPDDCSDEDGDGYGVGPGCDGPDCNDYVAEIHADEQCDDYCATHENAPGCPCDAVEPESCYTGPPGTMGNGECRGGLTTCRDGTWGPCDGQVLPVDETCDGLDNDCDGESDDGVLSECGTCGECERDCSGPAEGCEDWGEGVGTGVGETPEGWLILDGTAIRLHVIWPSSSGRGDIFRVNSETLEIEGAYWTGPHHAGGMMSGDSPSRTAVDDFGNVIISNRAFSTTGSITKIAADESDCVDANRNGRIDTSSGWDDKLDFSSHDDYEDECIMWHTQVGDSGAIPRGVAIHRVIGLDGVLQELGWVGLYSRSRFEQFDCETGELTGAIAPTPGLSPYGAAVDRDGIVWSTGLMGPQVGRFDTADPEDSFDTVNLPGGSAYRVIVDENNNPWIAGMSGVWRWNRDEEQFDTVPLVVGSVGNIASDGQGSVWAGTYANNEWVWRITNAPDERDDFESHQIATPGVRTFGTAVDFDGHAWAFNYFDGNAAIIDLEDEDVTVLMDDCGGNCLNMPYVRGDITGLQRRNALNPSGQWSKVVEGCIDGDTNWTRVIIDGLTPVGSNLAVSVRTADSVPGLAAVPWTQVGIVPEDGSDFDLDAALGDAGVEDAHLLEIQVILQSLDRATSPTLRGVEVQWGCDVIIG